MATEAPDIGSHSLQKQPESKGTPSELASSSSNPNHAPQTAPSSSRTLDVTTSGAGNLVLTLPSFSTPTFYLKNTVFSPGKNTPSLSLHSVSSTGPVLAVIKLGKLKPHTVGVGDPEKDDIAWEGLKKGGSWRSPSWDFEFGNGREKKGYRWESDGKLSMLTGKLDLVLKSKDEVEELARYKWSKGGKVTPWGTFDLKRGEGDGWSELELMILMTGLTIVISKGSGI